MNKESHFKNFHPFGCPVYVLNEDLQGNIKQPKWKPRTKVGVYLGRSKHHAADVSLILNTKTDFITPQYHVLFDDDFHTVTSASEDDEIEVWKGLFKTNSKSGIINQFKDKDKFSFDSPQINVMDLSSKGIANPVVNQQPLSNPRTKEHRKIKKFNKTNVNTVGLTNNNHSSVPNGTHVVRNQLITGTEPVPAVTQNSRKEEVVIQSEGATNSNHFEESDELMTSEGATSVTQQIQKKVTFAKSCKKPATSSKEKKRKPKFVFDASKDTVRTHSSQRISTRKRKRTKPFISAFHSMCYRATKFNKLSSSKQIKSCNSINNYANLAKLSNGEFNSIHPLAFAAGNLSANPNILNHRDAMKPADVKIFHNSMDEEMEKCEKNGIYELFESDL